MLEQLNTLSSTNIVGYLGYGSAEVLGNASVSTNLGVGFVACDIRTFAHELLRFF
jgi:hypothetical protein